VGEIISESVGGIIPERRAISAGIGTYTGGTAIHAITKSRFDDIAFEAERADAIANTSDRATGSEVQHG
jgi:hypothetical protein